MKKTSVINMYRLAAAGCLTLVAACQPAMALDYDLARDFSPATNPGSQWSYAAETALNAPITLFGVSGLVSGDLGEPIQYWQLAPGVEPTIYRNPGPATITIGGGAVTLPPTMVMLFSGSDQISEGFGVARFTAPAGSAQVYRIRAQANPVYDDPFTQGDTDFHVVHNGAEVFVRFLAGTETASYSNQVTLAAGDTVDFVVGRGVDNSGYASGLKLFANLEVATEVPPPPAPTVYDLAKDFSPTVNPSAAWSYGAEAQLSGLFSLFGVNGLVFGDGGAPIQYWQLLVNQEPTIYRNPSSQTITIGGGLVTLPPSMVLLFSGTDGVPNGFGVARFTTPAGQTGRYQIHTEARPIYDSPIQGDTDYHVVKNGKEIFRQNLSGTGQTQFSRSLHLQAGDTIDFVVGRGADNSGYASGLKILATLERLAQDDDSQGQ